MSLQLPLDLGVPDRYSRDNFVADEALHGVLDVVLHPQAWIAPHLVLLGPAGSGKTHIGHMFAEDAGGVFLDARDTFALDTGALQPCPYVVDDAETASQTALFHLINHVSQSRQYLVLLTQKPPLTWPEEVADLTSRLRAMRVLALPAPNEDLLRDILLGLFARRAISPSPDTIDYILRRTERSVGAVQRIVTELEHYANGRAFNRTLARDYFEGDAELPFAKDDQQDFDQIG